MNATPTRPATASDLTPVALLGIEIPRPAKLPSDFAPLMAWLAAGPGRECRLGFRGPARDGAWWVDLFDLHRCLASVGHTDPAVALARALEDAARAS